MRAAIRFDHGRPGSKIPGSVYVRAYCSVCGAPIRVRTKEQAIRRNECDNCRDLVRTERGRQRH